ncbi:thermonuclease family protein [Segnochrobactrum spirostomi]|uniref:TNase-like domain-containing protein n=1 Tax=Segnochrobactrum spirostomi TaxID=2608987 RepID=A0A6A7YAA9_9HYPH|nr:thermonuclease family protein [Segnochrobactrum spirostomi]MQT14409.1 hypothetical protein [Segnochrobactrum spirostomi]
MNAALRLAVTAFAIISTPALAADWHVIDGDTIVVDQERIRIADLDAPETHRSHCPAEREAGIRAQDALAQILASRTWAIDPVGTDRYGRTLAIVWLSDAPERRSVAAEMTAERVALPWIGRTRDWCALLASGGL